MGASKCYHAIALFQQDHDFNRMWMGNYGIIVKESENWLDHINENTGGDVQVIASMAID